MVVDLLMDMSSICQRVKMYTIIGFIVIIAGTNVMAQFACPNVEPVQNLDMKALGNGTWYEVARYAENSIEKSANGSNITCTMINGVVHYNLSDYISGQVHTIHGTIIQHPDARGKGILQYTIFTENGQHMPDLLLYVMAVDYNKYLILYNCIYDEKHKKRIELAWISARQLHIDRGIQDAITAFVNTHHTLDSRRLLWERYPD